ncbi:MAG: serine--tRNA ligase [Candidatus Staskawiczbacteria bacterium RIFCSPHIGHO2_02_FULL_43_16]|uniref:Serine--tRNA ligase n=1 Tax=Candidatus Staskawiczbacteria bacterium RIFCSPHIGHO2_01_FULL_41_41 TaxID=1802203 RepID=A0A1G2HU16_9BACT|nr:MAG: serine--tRNA ligase [Candidatus Staskawiczbacteria bacterium RIFCSPHIGHO2_01_FULL_41_41]OGZ68731.1 MAG: serine--tRNA ligase [Candidatus Staskawiczbacteria bacterium RIFCSPHIGHO2_02_FULL_43_16]OGZ75194.1 MAG: serine--tRNA ligase [Candidatus Staskawiczbacteria bacterium RIFCSPLOWO2_01_FULL_43_17b]
MLDIKFIRENPEKVKKACVDKNISVDVDTFLELDKKARGFQVEIENLRAERNKLTKNDIAATLKAGEPRPDGREKGRELKEKLKTLEESFAGADKERTDLHKKIPNIPVEDVPVGKTEDENQIIKTVGKKPVFDFSVKNHWQLGQELDLIDKERAAKIAGSRFAYIKGSLVQLQWAMMQFAVSVLTDEKTLAKIAKSAKLNVSTKPFVPVLPPLMIKTEPYDAMDRLEPREERYKIEGEDLWLQGSAEHVLGTMHMNETMNEQVFPIRYVGYATSFRKEAGTYGKDMEGIIRMHQFDKLEMESLTVAEESLKEHYFMVAIQEYLMQQLGLPYEVVLKCTADIGKPNARGVDINVWLPGQDKYRETHTADYMTDYQARRLQTRVRRNSGETQLVHTNDATAFSQRPLIAILENGQQKDGSVKIPKVLHKYTGFKVIKARKK